jgi:hypothetical protein
MKRVLLQSVDGDTTEFDFVIAESILIMPNSRWFLPKDSEYELENNGLRIKHITKAHTGKKEQ